jgi:hypothetical protein
MAFYRAAVFAAALAALNPSPCGPQVDDTLKYVAEDPECVYNFALEVYDAFGLNWLRQF